MGGSPGNTVAHAARAPAGRHTYRYIGKQIRSRLAATLARCMSLWKLKTTHYSEKRLDMGWCARAVKCKTCAEGFDKSSETRKRIFASGRTDGFTRITGLMAILWRKLSRSIRTRIGRSIGKVQGRTF